MNQPYYFTPWEEHRFWIEILQDHAYFIYNSLSPRDSANVRTAGHYIYEFGRMLENLNQLNPQLPPSDPTMIEFAKAVQPIAYGYYQFEGHMQSLRIQNLIELNLSPTYLNGTLGENREYLRLLQSYVVGIQPAPQSMSDLVDLWLEDQLGHASLLLNYIDVAELIWSEKIRGYLQTFSALMVKQRQMKGYLQFTPAGFPAQKQFAVEIITAVNGFAEVVHQIVTLYLKDRVLNKFTLRFIEHHFPETCYFLRKLSLYAPEVPVAPCALTKPSFGPLNMKDISIKEV